MGRKRNFTADGHISTDRREGKDKHDAYRRRSSHIITACGRVVSITGCRVKCEITPSWPNGKPYHYPELNTPATAGGNLLFCHQGLGDIDSDG